MSQSHHLRDEIGSGQGTHSDCMRSLLSVIDSRIVPQLLRDSAHAGTEPGSDATPFSADADQIAEFARLCYEEDERVGRDYLDRLRQQHHAVADVLLHLVAPAARWLGSRWDQDQIGFSEVTLGLLRMQNITRDFAAMDRHPQREAPDRFRALVASAPGSQHLLGLTMVSELFAADGWEVRVEVASTVPGSYQITFGGALLGINLAPLVAQLSTTQTQPSGSFKLGFAGQTTRNISYTADGASLAAALDEAAPQGVDGDFENVGGLVLCLAGLWLVNRR